MKVFSQIVLILVGLGVIYAGFNLLFDYQREQFAFENRLLTVYNTDFHWHQWLSTGDAYIGVAAVAVGAAMMVVAAITARLG